MPPPPSQRAVTSGYVAPPGAQYGSTPSSPYADGSARQMAPPVASVALRNPPSQRMGYSSSPTAADAWTANKMANQLPPQAVSR